MIVYAALKKEECDRNVAPLRLVETYSRRLSKGRRLTNRCSISRNKSGKKGTGRIMNDGEQERVSRFEAEVTDMYTTSDLTYGKAT